MVNSQQIVAAPAKTSMFVVITVNEGAEDQVKDVLTDVSGLSRSVGFRYPDANFINVVGIGASLWDRMFGEDTRPLHLHPFEEIKGDKHTAISTPGDLLLHIRADHLDMCFQMAKMVTDRLKGLAHVVDEVHGFKFYDDRDLLGFVDGTENPQGSAATDAVLVGDEDPAYAGGSYVIVQKYLHDMDAWEALSTSEQERVIGRSKLEDIEQPDDEKAPNAHIKLNVIEDEDGNQLQIMRDNMPFGSVGDAEFGTYFIGYAKDPAVTEKMLRNMFIGDPVGTYDRILDFSTAHTGCLFFTPSVDFLDDPQPVKRAEQGDGSSASSSSDGSDAGESDVNDDDTLGIGSLNSRSRKASA